MRVFPITDIERTFKQEYQARGFYEGGAYKVRIRYSTLQTLKTSGELGQLSETQSKSPNHPNWGTDPPNQSKQGGLKWLLLTSPV